MELSCRFCDTALHHTFVDLGDSPCANAYVRPEDIWKMEPFYSLHAFVCEKCFLVQLPAIEAAETIFSEYAYFSSFSATLLEHSRQYVEQMIDRFNFSSGHQVIEIASNDGYLLQYFRQHGIPVLGIEPAANIAEVATAAGIPSLVKFFGMQTARELSAVGMGADLLLGNNVLAHVPDLNDFVGGMKTILKENGVITMEFPHLMPLIEQYLFDTIYHEHFSYFSFYTVEKIFAHHGLVLFDVEEIAPQGGSLRIYARHDSDTSRPVEPRVNALREREIAAGITSLDFYRGFNEKVNRIKRELLTFLIAAKEENKRIAAYGAPAKGNTLLNFCGVRTDFIDYTVDVSPRKQGRLLPGTRIPVHAPNRIMESKPDYLLVLPWNIKDEIMRTMSGIREWGGKFVIPLPKLMVLS
jgi:SAM-dependent methyltransferase